MKEKIVMIHDMWVGGWYWKNYAEYLEKNGYQCICPTLRFHDMYPNAPPDPQLGTTSLLDYAADLEKEIQKLGEMPILIGHSMGGLLAQILGSRGLAKAIVLLTPASPYGIRALKPSVVRSFWSVTTRWAFWTKPMRQTFGEAVYSMLHLLPVVDQKATFDRMVYESGRAAFEIGYWLLDSRKASYVDESKVTCPVLVIAGSEDRITPASVVRKVAFKYKAVSTYKEYNNHAHWVIAEPGWEEIAEYVSRWLNQVSEKTAAS